MLDKKILLISHVADSDGITPIILARQTFKHVDISLVEIKDAVTALKEAIDKIDNYDEINMVDLNINEELALQIEENETLKNKIKIFDHHISGIELNRFSFINVIDEVNGRKECGSSLYLNYLQSICDNPILTKETTKAFVNYVRTMDTYDFGEIVKEEAEKIDILFSIFGKEDYVKHFSNFIKENEKFAFTEIENLLIDLEKKRIARYLESKEKELFKVKLDNYLVGLVYADRYRSELGNYLVNKYGELDFAILINVSRSISYRGKGKVDLSEFSKKYNGGGHKNAAGSPIPERFLENITKLIYDNIEFVGAENA